MNKKASFLISLIAFSALIAGCANEHSFKDNAKLEYEDAKRLVNKGQYNVASFNLEKFSSNYPYSSYAIQAELLRIFASYKGGEYVLSETLSSSFIDRHPRHANVDYAKYMLAMSFYKQRTSFKKDQSMNKSAIDAFLRLLREHPRSAYAKEGKRQLQALHNGIAKHELYVGKYYFDRDRYVAAANRFQEVAKSYQTTPAIEEALYYLAASYAKMGMQRDAQTTAKLLRHNYPNSSWSSKAKRYL